MQTKKGLVELYERMKSQDNGKFESKINELKVKVLIKNVRFCSKLSICFAYSMFDRKAVI